jgi:O-antigen polymerase
MEKIRKEAIVKNNNSYLDFLLLTILFVSLVNSSFFYDETSFSYFGFCITGLLFTIVIAIINKQLQFKKPMLFLGLLSVYAIWNSHYSNYSNQFAYYILINFLLLFAFTCAFSAASFNFVRFFKGIVLLATLESIYCIAQFFSLFKSENDFFGVTGTWINPNVTALFLALTAPVFFILFKSKYKKIIYCCFGLLIIALILLKCRSAYIGVIVAFIVYFGLQNNFVAWIKNKKNKIGVRILLGLSILVLFQLGTSLYNVKKESADGRKLIWKLSTEMILAKPLFGHGYGGFEREYNLYQVQKVKQNELTADELQNASLVLNAYNEVIQNALEGGLVGLFLIIVFVLSLVVSIRKKTIANHDVLIQQDGSYFNLAYAGIISFIATALSNFSIQAIPAMALFIVYAAIVCAHLPNLKLSNLAFIYKSSKINLAMRIVIIGSSIYLLYIIFATANADHQNRKAFLLKEENSTDKALLIMPDLEKHLKYEPYYWTNYANLYFNLNNYQMAINCLNKAKELSSFPEIYSGLAVCHEKMNRYDKAISNYQQLVLLHPGKFLYRFKLMETYLKINDTQNAIYVAKGLIELKPKVNSDKRVIYYKKMAKKVLEKLNVNKK